MSPSAIILSLVVASFLLSSLAFRPTLKWAIRHHIEDQPNLRKLQDHPIPMLGGVVIAFGIFLPLVFANFFFHLGIAYPLSAMAIMLVIGVLDDLYDIPAWLRLMVEIIVVWLLIWGTQSLINDFHGLFGITTPISLFLAIPLSIVAGVGIINSINLIDGVDGYSSGYGIAANSLFAIIFYHTGDKAQLCFSLVAAAALVPFFLHNVFGRTSKMFLGDGGSLLIGTIMACNVFHLLSNNNCIGLAMHGMGIVAVAMAILCIPVFDTLRVMFARILRKQSPIWPDKTHLHHRYIALGFSHFGTSSSIIAQNILIVGFWYLSYRIGWSMDGQFWVVVCLGLIATVGFYYGSEWCEKRANTLYKCLLRWGKRTHLEQSALWLKIQKWVDTF